MISTGYVMNIRLLPQNLINQIAAGEVIERPASVIKELVENAVDAGASRIAVKVINAGKSFISVKDDGCGMKPESLKMCIMSHATSKLSDGNLFNIHTMGFRGEALPSIISVARVNIMSSENGELGHKIELEGAEQIDFSPTNCSKGTTIEVRDLFFATPVRLKFLKSDAVEMDYCHTVFDRIALANKNIAFELSDERRVRCIYESADDLKKRVVDVFGEQFGKNVFFVDKKIDGMHLYGFLGVPTFNKSSSSYQYFFVNGRFVKDRLFFSALRSAYSTLIPAGRYPVAVLYLEIEPKAVDVNVHPTKIEVRFRNEDRVRYFIITTMKEVLVSYGATMVSTKLVDRFTEQLSHAQPSVSESSDCASRRVIAHNFERPNYESQKLFDVLATKQSADLVYNLSKRSPPHVNDVIDTYNVKLCREEQRNSVFYKEVEEQQQKISSKTNFLGIPLCQIRDTYIVSVSGDDLIIIDQHAAAERITLEKLRKNLVLDSQKLLLSETCNLNQAQMEALEKNEDFLKSFGIHYEKIGDNIIVVDALPTILETTDAVKVIVDIADELTEFGEIYTLEEKVHKVLSTASCHGSLRANHMLSYEAMDSLLRQMENTPNIGQCCHGRPSYVVLSLKELNKFFERS